MQKKNLQKKKAVIVSILILLVLVIGGMLAYFTDTDTATNIFTIGDDIEISISETGWTNTQNTNMWTKSEAEGLHPGATVSKAPVVNNDSDTTSAYVFAEIVVPCYDSDGDGTVETPLFSLNNVGNGWELIDTSSVDTTNKTITYVYAYAEEVSSELAMTELIHNTSTPAVFSSVTVDSNLTAEGAETASDTPNIVVNAYGIQVDSLSTSDPEEIFDLFATETPSSPSSQVSALSIGDPVEYSTSLNGITLDDWSVFYVDGNYTYLILDDYLLNSALSDSMKSTYNLFTYEVYSVFSTNSREDLVSAMTTKSNWDSLLTGTINGHAVNETRTENVWAMGSPDVELWANSWNVAYPSVLRLVMAMLKKTTFMTGILPLFVQ